MKNEYLKETFSDDKVIVSDVDINAMHRYISSNDAQIISDIVHDALTSMDIKHDGFGWDINVTVEQNNE
jgi:hypothetical protein